METIYTIPVNEAFDLGVENKESGCPFCTLYKKLEANELDLILGASMMEPDVRIMTNDLGFCRRHFDKMFHLKNRLGLALILESHIAEVRKKLHGEGLGALKGGRAAEAVRKLSALEASCYVCRRIDQNLDRMADTAVILYESDRAFRKKLAEQPYFCLPHYRLLIEKAKKNMQKKLFPVFHKEMETIEEKALDTLGNDVSWFCKKFDYRYNDEPWYNAKDAVERTIRFLSGLKEE